MSGRKLLIGTILAACCALWMGLASRAEAQLGPQPPRAMTPRLPNGAALMEGLEQMGRNLDRFGKNLVEGIAPGRGPAARSAPPTRSLGPMQVEKRPGRLGSSAARTSTQSNVSPRAAVARPSSGASRPVTRSPQRTTNSSLSRSTTRSSTAAASPAVRSTPRPPAATGRSASLLDLPLHERLSALRNSAFQGQAQTTESQQSTSPQGGSRREQTRARGVPATSGSPSAGLGSAGQPRPMPTLGASPSPRQTGTAAASRGMGLPAGGLPAASAHRSATAGATDGAAIRPAP